MSNKGNMNSNNKTLTNVNIIYSNNYRVNSRIDAFPSFVQYSKISRNNTTFPAETLKSKYS